KLPTEYTLCQNYPNPFNPSTTIKYEIPGQARNDNTFVTLKVYDILGREVTTLVNKQQKPGYYEVKWNSLSASGGHSVSSGIYFYQLKVYSARGEAGLFVQSKKLMLMK
ncbi:MAG: FlgD immunoglobulin-like domain containing protein, partial [Bacteroidota bacterium]